MPIMVQISLVGLIAGIVGTSLGGALSLAIRNPRQMMVGALMAISGGIMLTVVFRDLIPEALQMGSVATTVVGALFGVGLMRLLDVWIPESALSQASDNVHHFRLMRASVLLGLGIALHNLPEGMAIGAGYAASQNLGLGIALVIALHNIPEGLAMAGPMRGAGLEGARIVAWTGAAGVPMGIGAYFGAMLGEVSPLFLSTALGFASGAMLFIIFNQLLPDAKRLSTGGHAAIATAAGVVTGLLILKVVHLIPIA